MKPSLLLFALLAGASLAPAATTPGAAAAAPAGTDNVRAYLDMMRSDTNATKIKVLNEVMRLTAEEAKKFWPIYREYEKEQGAVGEQKLRLIREFFAHYSEAGALNDETAKALAPKWLQVAQDRLDLWKKYHAKISAAVSPLRAAQFLQVENQLAIFVDLGIASEMPSLGATPTTKAAK
jgi:hypothetical protein